MGRSKEAKSRRHAKRMARRRAIKAAKKALYDAKIAAGRNKKPKRAQKAGVVVKSERMDITIVVPFRGKVVKRVHGGLPCKNIGCLRCSEVARKAAA